MPHIPAAPATHNRPVPMNTKCPQCGNPYNVTEAHIGRKSKCKTCASALVVTADGVDLQNPTAAAAVVTSPPPIPAASAFSFDDAAEATPALTRPVKAGKQRPVVMDEDDDDRGARPARAAAKPRAPREPGALGNYLRFRKMVVPVVIQIVFWFLVVVGVVGGLIIAGISAMSENTRVILSAAAGIVIGIPIYILLIRMYCELVIVVFRISDTLTEIKQVLERTDR